MRLGGIFFSKLGLWRSGYRYFFSKQIWLMVLADSHRHRIAFQDIPGYQEMQATKPARQPVNARGPTAAQLGEADLGGAGSGSARGKHPAPWFDSFETFHCFFRSFFSFLFFLSFFLSFFQHEFL